MTEKMTINIIVPGLSKTKFAGGTYCVLKYADGLAKKGHTVNVVPWWRSKKPVWIQCCANYLLKAPQNLFRGSIKEIRSNLMKSFDQYTFNRKGRFTRQGIILDYMCNAIPEADVTIGTAWESAEMVYRFGTGRKAYFMQHFESIFFEDDVYEKWQCEWTYLLPLHKIANSSWLQNKMNDYLRSMNQSHKVHRCINAVDLDVYRRDPDAKEFDPKVVRIISYGGRNVPWKGFDELAEAVAIARKKLSDVSVLWQVYGSASLPPNNKIAPYESLGFLQPKDLCRAYNAADILLSASWYESFPLFPIEGMACGLAVITTSQGTEDYAVNGETAEIVRERDPEDIARGLIKVISDKEYRNKLAREGYKKAQEFNWKRSVDNMEQVLREIIA